MSDDVRTPRTFEPPPWERDQFDELRKRREAEQEAERVAAEAGAARAATGPEVATTPSASTAASWVPPMTAGTAPPEADVNVMMMELAAQEPDAATPFRKAGYVIAVVIVVVGVLTVIAGVVGLIVQGGHGGVMGNLAGSIVVAFGLLLVAGGSWLTILALKQRGA